MEHRSGILSLKLSKVEDCRLGRVTSVGHAKQVVERAEGCPHDPYRCNMCGLMPEDDSSCCSWWEREIVRSHKSRTRCCCACCGGPRDHETVTIQYRYEGKSCIVYQAEYPPQGNCKSVMEALIMANNVHEEDVSSHKVTTHRTVFGGLRSHTLEKLPASWRSWTEQDRLAWQAVSWAAVKANIVVEQVVSPVTHAEGLWHWRATSLHPHCRVWQSWRQSSLAHPWWNPIGFIW